MLEFYYAYRYCVSKGHNFEDSLARSLQLLLRENPNDFFEKQECVENSFQVGVASSIRFDIGDEMFGSSENIVF